MKSGKIIAFVITAAVVVSVYYASRTPDAKTPSEEVTPATTEVEAEPNTTLDKKVEEAVAIIQSGDQPPMVAIQKLREVIAEDSNHVGANYWLGEFSVMSGQYEKAIPRYAKVLSQQPDNVEVCIKLAKAYGASGQAKQGVALIDDFLVNNPDEKIKEQLMPVLNELIVES